MSLSANHFRPKRLCDYFCVVGIEDELRPLADREQVTRLNASPLQLRYNATVLDRYPFTDHEDTPFPEGIALFCLPDGLALTTEVKLPHFFSFVHTDGHGSHMIGNCLTFYEELSEVQKTNFRRLVADRNSKLPNEADHFSLESIRRVCQPKCLCLLSHWPYTIPFRKWLTSLYRSSLGPSEIPVERYICNLVEEVPAPPPGRVELNYYFGDQVIQFRCPPPNNPLMWSGVPFRPIFECLEIENILLLFSLLLQERQIVFVSSQFSLLTMACETITSLLYPLVWSHVYIPIVPRTIAMTGLLNAPIPFIVGVHSSFLRVAQDAGVSDEIVYVYLDSNSIVLGSRGMPPALPERRSAKLAAALRILLSLLAFDSIPQAHANFFATRDRDWLNTVLPFFDCAIQHTRRPIEATGEDDVVAVTQSDDGELREQGPERAVREAFLKFFAWLFKDYREFMGPINEQSSEYVTSPFREDEFLAAQASEVAEFLRPLLKTQAFNVFIDDRAFGDVEDADVVFFNESIDAKLNRYTFRIRTRETPFLSDKQSHTYKTTCVPPTPDTSNLPQQTFTYERFPRLDPSLFYPPRPMLGAIEFQANHRMKRRSLKSGSNITGESLSITEVECVYTTFFILYASAIKREREKVMATRTFAKHISREEAQINVVPGHEVAQDDTQTQALSDWSNDSSPSNFNALTLKVDESPMPIPLGVSDDSAEEMYMTSTSALDVCFDLLNLMTAHNHRIEECVFRKMMEASAKCASSSSALRLLELMQLAQIQPDTDMMRLVLHTFAMDQSSTKATHATAGHSFSAKRSLAKLTSQEITKQFAKSRPGSGVKSPAPSDMPRNPVPRSRSADHFGSPLPEDFSNRPATQDRHQRRRSSFAREAASLEDWVPFGRRIRCPSDYSSGLKHQIVFSERIIEVIFPGLIIDLDSETCPKCHCRLLSGDICRGWKPDPQSYTTTCYQCARDFVPRFSVMWGASDGPATPIYCEYLSPWVLKKETYTIVFRDGIETVLHENFRDQKPTIFWNLIVAFRQRRLPSSFLVGPLCIPILPDVEEEA